MDIQAAISTELGVRPEQVQAAVTLLDEGSTVPFIARYRKEATGGLDDTQLRTLEERLRYLRELEERRAVVLKSIADQGQLTDELRVAIESADSKTRLEDLYLPFKPKRRTKGQIAKEAGLEPLADLLLSSPENDPETAAAGFVSEERGVADVAAALEGAKSILMERFAEEPEVVGPLREHWRANARVRSTVVEEKKESGAKFRDYFDFSEMIAKVPSHRALALLRGRSEGVIRIAIETKEEVENEGRSLHAETTIGTRFGIASRGRPADAWLEDAIRTAWKTKLKPHLETGLLVELREAAEEEAIRVFARNLHDLLLAAPGGPKVTMGLDPGLRTGVKVAVVDATGKLLTHATIYPHAPRKKWDESIAVLAELCREHSVALVSIGNGTASRETDRLVRDLVVRHPELSLQALVVSESGASVYSASELAAKEFPDLDVSFRGAVSIARRLQDPLAELVKIEPKSIGVGQYQHDVNQSRLARSLDAVVEDCVNAVGVDVNMASVPLLARVSGLNRTLAENIVRHRDSNGPFRTRSDLLQVARMGEKTFEQSAGFLRIMDGDEPLDRSAVHPEAYPVVHRISETTGRGLAELLGQREFLRSLTASDFTDDRFGLPTVTDILAELEKPGRDPRPDFVTATFKEGVEKPEDLAPGMLLEGVVTNVTNFGAFVDIGVHQDGLVHISRLSSKFVQDAHDVVKAGDIVKVKVLEVDLPRKRIGLTMILEDAKPDGAQRRRPERGRGRGGDAGQRPSRGEGRSSEGRSGGGRSGGGRSETARSEGGERGRRPSGPPRERRGDTRRPPSPPKQPTNTLFGKLLDQALAEAEARARRDES